jgi:lipid A ethanolaminephosphotransferase
MSGGEFGRKLGWLSAIAKVVGSAMLMAATMGLLWHDRSPVHWPNIPPPFLSDLASGWYESIYWTARNLLVHSAKAGSIYLVACAGCVLALFAAPFIAQPLLRATASAVLLFGIGYDLVMFDIGGDLPSFSTTQTILTNAWFGIHGTAQVYLVPIVANTALVALALAIFCLPPPPLRRLQHVPMLVVLLAGIGVLGIFVETRAQTRTFPSPFASYLNAVRVAAGGGRIELRDVDYAGTPTTPLRKIVLVLDESVRGDYLSLNRADAATTPFLDAHRDAISNFGIASSVANCSYESRMMMRFGSDERDIRNGSEPRFPGPTVWQYAKRAGFETVYIDSFGSATRFTHGMTSAELASVDRRIITDDKPQYERDPGNAGKLQALLRDPSPMFILVEKYGVHVPYNAQYPASANVFGVAHDRTFDPANRPKLVGQYRNAIRWSVDGFFASLLQQPLPPATLLLYTSDHGQALAENDRRQTHCSQGRLAIRQEADVPLFALSSDATWQAALSQAARQNHDRASAFDVFPTLLAAMGYDRGWIDARFAYSLTGAMPADRKRLFWAMTRAQPYD